MKFSYDNNLNNTHYLCQNPTFTAVTTSPAKTITKPTETKKNEERPIDTIAKKVEEEKEKKSNKKAFAVGGTVLGIATLVALLNPKNASNLAYKLKNMSEKAAKNIEKNKNNYFASKFHKATKTTFDWGIKTLQFSNNINSIKDIGFTWLCCEKKAFHNIENYNTRKVLKKIDSGFVKVMKSAHHGITNFFESISKATVKRKYKKTLAQMNELEQCLLKYKEKLPADQKIILESKLTEINLIKDYFSETNISQRLLEQEKLMSNLERDVMKKFRSYRNGFSNKWVSNKDHIGENLSFWAQDILMPTRNKVEKQGLEVVEKITGNASGKTGLYDDIFTILDKHLGASEKEKLAKNIKKTKDKLTKANHAECVEFFNKKIDLTLGSAPTDIVTASIGLGASGVAIVSADDKEQRLSRTLTAAFPVIAGIGTNLAFTAMLFSGVQGMLMGAGTGVILSKIGSIADEKLLGNTEKPTDKKQKATQSTEQQEVKHA